MDRDIGEKQAGHFREDIRLARATERTDGGRHRDIEDRGIRCWKTHARRVSNKPATRHALSRQQLPGDNRAAAH